MSVDLKQLIARYTQQVDQQLQNILPAEVGPAKHLYAAMRYSVFNGGKRLRPALCFAAAEAVGNSDDNTAKVAAALEMIHAYSLIHDDLPAMDDDSLRRGVPTCHIQFDEATAILAGDALQSLAFKQLTELSDLPAETNLKLVALLANLAGCNGMVSGQAIDLAATGNFVDIGQLTTMHSHKTGALIEASVRMGAMATAEASQEQLDALGEFAQAIGLAFQVQDDILDDLSSTEELGKNQGSDKANQKSTYVSILGMEKAQSEAQRLYQESIQALDLFADRAEPLRALAAFIVQRTY